MTSHVRARPTAMQQLILSSYDDLYLIDLSNVVYFMADDHYTHVYYSSKTHFLVPFGLSKIEERLIEQQSVEGKNFMRLGRKYIVDLRRVFHISVSKQQLFLFDDTGTNFLLQVSKPVLRGLHELLEK